MGELALVFDLCDQADALEAIVESAVLALTVDPLHGRAGLSYLPVVDSSPLTLALRGLAAHKLRRWRGASASTPHACSAAAAGRRPTASLTPSGSR